MNELVQCVFRSGNEYRVASVPVDSRLHLGVAVTLSNSEDPTRWWTITEMGRPMPKSFLKRHWHNNI